MFERDFLAPEKRIRHAAQPRARRDGAAQANAGDARARRAQLAKARQAFRAARD